MPCPALPYPEEELNLTEIKVESSRFERSLLYIYIYIYIYRAKDLRQKHVCVSRVLAHSKLVVKL